MILTDEGDVDVSDVVSVEVFLDVLEHLQLQVVVSVGLTICLHLALPVLKLSLLGFVLVLEFYDVAGHLSFLLGLDDCDLVLDLLNLGLVLENVVLMFYFFFLHLLSSIHLNFFKTLLDLGFFSLSGQSRILLNSLEVLLGCSQSLVFVGL